MSGVSVTIDDRRVRDALNDMRSRVRNLRPAMDRIGATLADRVRLGFHDGKDPWGQRWQPLRPATVSRRRQGSDKPLRDTGRLMNSISHRATRHSVTIGTDVEYAATHQFGARKGQFGRTRKGSPIPWGNIPARRFMPIDDRGARLPDEWIDDIGMTLRQHIEVES